MLKGRRKLKILPLGENEWEFAPPLLFDSIKISSLVDDTHSWWEYSMISVVITLLWKHFTGIPRNNAPSVIWVSLFPAEFISQVHHHGTQPTFSSLSFRLLPYRPHTPSGRSLCSRGLPMLLCLCLAQIPLYPCSSWSQYPNLAKGRGLGFPSTFPRDPTSVICQSIPHFPWSSSALHFISLDWASFISFLDHCKASCDDWLRYLVKHCFLVHLFRCLQKKLAIE